MPVIAPGPGIVGPPPGGGAPPGGGVVPTGADTGAGPGVTPPIGGGLPAGATPLGKNAAGLKNIALGVGFLMLGLRDMDISSDIGQTVSKFLGDMRKHLPSADTVSGDAQKLSALRQRAMRPPPSMPGAQMGGAGMVPPGIGPAAGAPPPGPPPTAGAGPM